MSTCTSAWWGHRTNGWHCCFAIGCGHIAASVPAYSAFKRALAAVVPTVDVYTDIKDPVIDLVVTVTEEWAATTGWQIRSTSST